MLDIDQYAYSNNLRSIHPVEKTIFALLTMIICLAANSIITSLAIILLMAGVVIFGAKIPRQFFIKLILIPISFLLISTITIVISISKEASSFLYYLSLWGWKIGIQMENIIFAINLFLKSLGTVSCLYFLALTTPMIEIISVLRKLKVPRIFIELMSLIYRFIFVLLDNANLIRTSQLSRLGYSNFKRSCQSLSKLISNLFIRAYYRAKGLLTTLLARGYEGEIRVLEPEYEFSKKNLAIIFLVEVSLILITVYIGGDQFVIINT
ncbi:cobalt/nickel transport system permease protein [Candidatus Frackibacter sp. WG11]|uniref:cobalt ECF transporter T component CbiQ n=1 Tax=Candidatus Frackibacter sp. WG11 TaxID=2017976 RepID=UPI00087F77F2|nr:cobalt ECF transporter T component CbiQ [Candidatus Frackibacter sp. WG11]SDC34401.1 cobalt/nickel transport system permease protein [Candidatus Frackibacter sp. WG11]